MKPEDIVKLFLAIFALFSPLFALFSTLRPSLQWRQQALQRVGAPGRLYDFTIWYPLQLFRLALLVTVLLSFALLVEGAFLLSGRTLPKAAARFAYTFDYPYLIGLCILVVVLYACIYLNPVSRALVWATYRLDHFRFTSGWANAHWQLTHYRNFFALGVEQNEVERLSNSVVSHLVTKGQATQPDQTPQPAGAKPEELANYLFIGFVIESHLHKLYPNDRDRLNAAWKFLELATLTPSRPFLPTSIMRTTRSNLPFFEVLGTSLPNPPAGATLPQDQLVRSSVNQAAIWISRRFRGNARRMAFGWLNRKPSIVVLAKHLRRKNEFKGGMLHVFIKVSIRMNIWPSMEAGAFKYAYADGLAILMLNSGCIVPPGDIIQIEVDQAFKDLISGVEDQLINRAFDIFAQPTPSQEALAASHRIFGVSEPSLVGDRKFKDYVDLFLWRHTRQFCIKRIHQKGVQLGCELGSTTAGCACDRTEYCWIRQDLTLLRREVK